MIETEIRLQKTERKYYIDWLRITAFYILIFYHVGMIFVPWTFHIKNNQTSEWFETWMAFLSQWRLPLLFMISGMVIYYSLGKRSGKTFLWERIKRLLIPLIFGMLVIVPPQIYFERISNGITYAGYFSFWKTVFDFKPYPMGGSVSWHHLWYVLYIFVYSIIALPLFLYLRGNKSIEVKNKLGKFIQSYPYSIYLIFFPLIIFYFTLSSLYPTTHNLISDWYNHSISFSLFVFGFFISSVDGIDEVIIQKRKVSLIMAIIPAAILILFVWGPTFEIFNEQDKKFEILYGLLNWIFIVSWLLAILGYSKILLNKSNKFLHYANESVYPLYILHQTVLICFGYYVIQWDIGILTKFILLVILTFGGSFIFYELFIKRFNIMRVLFGMKTLSKK